MGMTGNARYNRLILPVEFLLSNHDAVSVEFVVDTGFSGFLTLPVLAVQSLGLQFRDQTDAHLADGSNLIVDRYRASIVWNGELKQASVLATGDRPLLGTALLRGMELHAQFVEGGRVEIVPCQAPA